MTHGPDEHDPGAQLRHGHHARRAIRTSSCSARTSAFSAACSASPTVCSASTASIACSIRRSPRAASSRAAIGMGVNGLRPVAEIQFADYIYPAYDQIVSELARLRYRSAGEFWAPITIRTPCGGGIRGGQTHSQSPEGIFTHVCGIKVVMPSNPYDAKGLLIAAIEDDDPVVFFEPKRLYNGPFDGDPNKPAVPWSTHPKGDVPDGYLHRADRQRRDRARGQPAHDRHLRHDGPRLRGRCALARARRRDHRRAFDGAARRGHDLQLGEPHRTLRRRARGDALLGFRRRALGDRSRSSASGISRRRSSASRAGTRPIRTRSSGSIFPARRALRSPSKAAWRSS